jgi:hypothetical protein
VKVPAARRTYPDLGELTDIVADLLRESAVPAREVLARRLRSYEHALALELEPIHSQDALLGHEDVFLYQPARVAVVVLRGTEELDLVTTLVAARFVNARVEVFLEESLTGPVAQRIAAVGASRFASLREAAGRLAEREFERVRILEPTPGEALAVLSAVAPLVDDEPVSDSGYVELRRYVLEQSRSIAHHRYGNLSLHFALEAAKKKRKRKVTP